MRNPNFDGLSIRGIAIRARHDSGREFGWPLRLLFELEEEYWSGLDFCASSLFAQQIREEQCIANRSH